jgi:hypothetical protein
VGLNAATRLLAALMTLRTWGDGSVAVPQTTVLSSVPVVTSRPPSAENATPCTALACAGSSAAR